MRLTRRASGAVVAIAALCLLAQPAAAAATSSPNDPLFSNGDQWALSGAPASILAPPAWCSATGAGVLVADVDTGVDFSHPDLAGKVVAGARFTNGDGSLTGTGQAAVQDDNGHGTMTSGIVAADTNNGKGIAAVAPGARILAVKVLDSAGGGSDSDVAAGIDYAVSAGAKVINLSIGPDVPLTGVISAIPAAIQNAWKANVIVAVAAGNAGIPAASYQSLSSDSLVAGALGRDATPAYYSNSGVGVNIYAPGGDESGAADVQHGVVSTTLGGGYGFAQGTSFAAPQVAGVVALLVGRGMSAADAWKAVTSSASRRNGFPDLNAAASLGVPATATCSGAATATATPAGRPGAAAPAHGTTSTTQPPSATSPSPGAPRPVIASGVSVGGTGTGASGVGDAGGIAAASGAPAAVGVGLVAVALGAGAYLVRRRRA